MRVILNEDVDRLGVAGEVVTVAPGYARNYLFPNRMAVPATKGALRDLERRRDALKRREDSRRSAAEERLDQLREASIVVVHKAGAEGKLHGSVTTQDIADALSAGTGVEVDKGRIDLVEPIRQIGSYLVTVRLFRDIAYELPVTVRSESGVPEARAAEAAAEAERRAQEDEEARARAAAKAKASERAAADEEPTEEEAEPAPEAESADDAATEEAPPEETPDTSD